MGYVNKVNDGNGTHLIEPTLYTTCSTDASTATKQTAAIDSFSLVSGVQVTVKFTTTNTAAVSGLKLQIGSDTNTAKPIKYRGANLPAKGTLAANRVYTFVYDGTNWELIGDLDTNTQSNYGNITTAGKIGTTADLAVYTTTGGLVIAGSLKTDAPSASGNDTSFITSISQDSKGKISASKATIPAASTSVAGITTVGASGGAAAYSHTHDYLPVSYTTPDFSVATTTNGAYPLTRGNNPVTGTPEYGGALQFGASASSTNYYAAQLVVSSASGATSPVHAYIRRMTSTPVWSEWSTLLDNKNTTAPSTVPTLSWNTESTVFTLNGTAVKVKAMAKPTYAFTDLTSHPTTLSGYGITDAKISSGVITLGSNTITPVTKVNGHTGSEVTVTASDLGLSSAMHFLGVSTTTITDGGTENPTIGGTAITTKTAGDVVIDNNSRREYVWSTTNKWEMLGFDASTAYSQTTSGNTFISKVSQATDGTVTAETRALDTSGAWTGSAAKLSNTSKVGDTDRPVYFTAGGVPSAVTYRMAATNTTATTAVAIADNLNTGIWYVNGTSSILGQSDGAVIVNKYNDNQITEMYQDYRTGQLAIRGKNNGTWQNWRKVLDTENWQTTAGIEIIRLS